MPTARQARREIQNKGEQGSISQRVRTSPNLGLFLGDIQIAWIVLILPPWLGQVTGPNSR